MAKYQLTNKAVDDLTRIWNYTFDNWSENQADKYYHMLLENCNEVACNPELGKNYSLLTEKDKANTTIHVKNIQTIDLDTFSQLKENDILFIDSTHVSKVDSDVNRAILDILPRLNKGV